MVGRLLRSLSALVVLVAVVVGAPIALWVLGRDLLPAGVPSLGEVWDGLTSRDTGGVFLGSAGRDRVHRVGRLHRLRGAGDRRAAGRPASGLADPAAPRPAVSGHRVDQRHPDRHRDARRTQRGGRPRTRPGPAPVPVRRNRGHRRPGTDHRVAPPPRHPNHHSTPVGSASAQAPAGPVWTVARYDTFWGIADKTLGDGRRYQEIVDLNVGVDPGRRGCGAGLVDQPGDRLAAAASR